MVLFRMAAIGWISLQTYKICRVIDSQLTEYK